jgi:hypothetical protein
MDASQASPGSEMDTGLPGPSNAQGFVGFLTHGNFFDEQVDPSKRRCRGVGVGGGAPELPRGPRQERSRQASGVRSTTLGFRQKVPGMERRRLAQIGGPCARGAARVIELSTAGGSMEKKMRKGALRAARDVTESRSETASETDGVYFRARRE